jgi:hypothetical protein
MAVLRSDDDRVTFYLRPLAVEFEDEEPRWLEYEMGFRVALAPGGELVGGSEGLSLSVIESELVELITRLLRLSEAPGEGVVRYEGTDPDFRLQVTREAALPEEGEEEAPARTSAEGSVRVEVWVDLACLQRTAPVLEPGRARAGLQFHTTGERLSAFVEQLRREFAQAAGREFLPREEPTLPAEVPFSRILNLFNQKDWQERQLACRLLERSGEARAITLLLAALTDATAWVRESAALVLARLTGQSFGYDAFAPLVERHQAVRRVQTWWQANRLSYVSPKRRPPPST